MASMHIHYISGSKGRETAEHDVPFVFKECYCRFLITDNSNINGVALYTRKLVSNQLSIWSTTSTNKNILVDESLNFWVISCKIADKLSVFVDSLTTERE